MIVVIFITPLMPPCLSCKELPPTFDFEERTLNGFREVDILIILPTPFIPILAKIRVRNRFSFLVYVVIHVWVILKYRHRVRRDIHSHMIPILVKTFNKRSNHNHVSKCTVSDDTSALVKW